MPRLLEPAERAAFFGECSVRFVGGGVGGGLTPPLVEDNPHTND